MQNQKNELINESEIKTVLAKDIDFNGELIFEEPIIIKGKVKGEIKAHHYLLIEEKAEVEAHIVGQSVDVRGLVRGNIEASETIHLRASAFIDGDVTAPEVIMESGSRFNGICNMTGKKDGSR